MTDIENLYRQYFTDVYLYIKSLSHDQSVAEELTSETFFKALKALDGFRGDCDIRIWLCQIAKNTYYTYLKKQGSTVPLEEVSECISDECIENNFVSRDTSEVIHKCIHELSEPYKEIFTLRVFAELSFKQIAALFGKTENWACVTYHRAKTKIKEYMEESK